MEDENNKIIYIKAYLGLKSWDESYLIKCQKFDFANLNTQKSKAI